MNITAKILPAHYFPNMILFKIFNEINLSFGVILVACDLILLRKMILSCQLPLIIFENKKDLIRFARNTTVLKSIKIKKSIFWQGRSIGQNVGGVLSVTTKRSQALKCHKPELSIFIRSQDMFV